MTDRRSKRQAIAKRRHRRIAAWLTMATITTAGFVWTCSFVGDTTPRDAIERHGSIQTAPAEVTTTTLPPVTEQQALAALEPFCAKRGQAASAWTEHKADGSSEVVGRCEGSLPRKSASPTTSTTTVNVQDIATQPIPQGIGSGGSAHDPNGGMATDTMSTLPGCTAHDVDPFACNR